mmetsp:Transcript_3174/g.5920  ORF Transcript_3174/g.5920 Transcript_3174/m.5920 type:complete len:460 (-) Transcript_3174:1559-2938(-)
MSCIASSVVLLHPCASALVAHTNVIPPTVPNAFFVSKNNPGGFSFVQQDNIQRQQQQQQQVLTTMDMNKNNWNYGSEQEILQQQGLKEKKSDTVSIVAYKEFQLRLPPEYGNTIVPVATWFQPDEDEMQSQKQQQQLQGQHNVQYSHRISVPRIASLLAGIQFIPPFVAKDFTLSPTISTDKSIVVEGQNLSFPTSTDRPVVILAHGFLGSRYDLSHLAEELASQGFVCFSPEYPESLASSYVIPDKNKDGEEEGLKDGRLDRTTINQALLQAMEMEMKVRPTSFGIVGHSLGCGTATSTGDDTWTRVCIAGPPVRRNMEGGDNQPDLGGNILGIVSLNDGLITRSRLESMIPMDFTRLEEEVLLESSSSSSSSSSSIFAFPKKSILILDRPDAPNHISFLAGNANDAMVSFLSPLLPVAQALSIPVLDFDKYKTSRDSDATAKVVIPIVSAFLRQNMI